MTANLIATAKADPAALAGSFAESAARAAVSIIRQKGLRADDAALTALSGALKAAAMPAYDELVADLTDAQFMGEAMLTEIFRAAAVSLAIASLKAADLMPARAA